MEVGKVHDTQCGVPKLEPTKKYKFRVKAVNSEGISAPLISEKETLAKDPWGKCTYLHALDIKNNIISIVSGPEFYFRYSLLAWLY